MAPVPPDSQTQKEVAILDGIDDVYMLVIIGAGFILAAGFVIGRLYGDFNENQAVNSDQNP